MHNIAKQKLVEKRRFFRNECSVNVEYPDDSGTHNKGIISDISHGGAFIDTRKVLEIGQDILMRVHLPELPKPMAMIGEVVRHSPNGMGVRFNMTFGISAINSLLKCG